jgi:hypothetical protein
MRFGSNGESVHDARGHWEFLGNRKTFVDGFCGFDGKYWEKRK